MNSPLAFVVPEHRVVELFQTSVYGAKPPNPLPVTLTVAPTGPLPEAVVNEGVTRKLMLRRLGPWVTMMVPFPPGSVGRVNVHENAPLESVIIVVPLNVPAKHAVAVRSTPSKPTVAPALTSNPEPPTLNELPTGP